MTSQAAANSQARYKIASSPKNVIARFNSEDEIGPWVAENCEWHKATWDRTWELAEAKQFPYTKIDVYERKMVSSGDGEMIYGAWVLCSPLSHYLARKISQ